MRETARHLTFITLLLGGLLLAALCGFRAYNDPVRKAHRALEAQGVAISVEGAVDAAARNQVAVLQNLVTVGVQVQEKDDEGITPLIAAVKKHSIAALDVLLSQPVVCEQIDKADTTQSWTALGHALDARNYELARQLLKAGAKPDVQLVPGVPLVVEALQIRDIKLFEFLLEAGADPDAATGDGQTCLALALENQNGEWLALLKSYSANASINSPGGEPVLLEQVRLSYDDQVAGLLDGGADPNAATESGATALIAAVQLGDRAMTKLLLDRGADPSLADAKSRAPLHFALEKADHDFVAVLLEAGANTESDALVHQAYRTGDLDLLSRLLKAGAPPEAKNAEGVRLLEVAVEAGNFAAADLILEQGANCEGMLWPSLRSGKDEVLTLVLKYGANVREKDQDGIDPLAFALSNDRASAAALLLDAGAAANVDHPDGGTWLSRLIVAGKNDMALSLLEHGACFEGETAPDGHSLLAWAIANDAGDVARQMILAGADVMATEPSPASEAFREKFASSTFRYHLEKDRGINLLMIAAAKKNYTAARALIEAGAKPGVYSKGKTLWPINIAAWYGDVEMMRIMLGKLQPDGRKIVIDLSSQKATFFENGEVRFTTRVSTGKSGYSTPAGHYVVTNKHRTWTSTIYDASMPYFLRLSCGSFGLHQGYVPSYPASHGCIRVPAGNAASMFSLAELGDEVVIQN